MLISLLCFNLIVYSVFAVYTHIVHAREWIVGYRGHSVWHAAHTEPSAEHQCHYQVQGHRCAQAFRVVEFPVEEAGRRYDGQYLISLITVRLCANAVLSLSVNSTCETFIRKQNAIKPTAANSKWFFSRFTHCSNAYVSYSRVDGLLVYCEVACAVQVTSTISWTMVCWCEASLKRTTETMFATPRCLRWAPLMSESSKSKCTVGNSTRHGTIVCRLTLLMLQDRIALAHWPERG